MKNKAFIKIYMYVTKVLNKSGRKLKKISEIKGGKLCYKQRKRWLQEMVKKFNQPIIKENLL